MHTCKPICKCKLLLKPPPSALPEKTVVSSESSENVEIEQESKTDSRLKSQFDKTSHISIKSCYCSKHGFSTEWSEFKVEHEELPDLDGLLGLKMRLPSIITKTEEYLQMHRINELVHFLMVKILSHAPDKPITFLINLLDECMLFRAGHSSSALILFEKRHLQAVINSFDPGNRGWLTICQLRRIYWTLNLNFYGYSGKKFTTDEVLRKLEEQQEKELVQLLSAGMDTVEKSEFDTSNSSQSTLISNGSRQHQ